MRTTLALVTAALLLSGCYYYAPPPYTMTVPAPGPSRYEQAWDAALTAARDAGVKVTQADRATGIIRGDRPPMEVTITVKPLPDGGAQVAINAKGSPREEDALARQISEAYHARMGRGY